MMMAYGKSKHVAYIIFHKKNSLVVYDCLLYNIHLIENVVAVRTRVTYLRLGRD